MIHILHLEDEPVDSQLAADLLIADGLEVALERVHTLAAFQEGLARPGLDLILSDFTVPGMDALEALRLARQLRPEVPFLYFSGTIGEEMAIETLRQGATDYILKGHSSRLPPAVRRALHEAEEQSWRRAGEQALAKTTARLDAIISSAMDAIISIDAQQRIVLFNPAAEAMFGMPAKQALGMSLSQLIPKRFRAAHARHVEDFGRTGVSSRSMGQLGTISGLRANGEEFPIEASISQTEIGGDKLFTVILRDVTQRQQAEEELRQSQERLRLFIEHAPAAIAMFDREMRYLAASQRWLADYRLSGQDIIGRSHYEVFPDAPDRWKDVHRHCLAGAVETAQEDLFQRADGNRRWLRWEVRPWHAEGGTVGGIIIFTEDITDIVAAREALARSHTELERQVAERTDQLKQANANLQNFAHTAAHDLRAPLRAIKSFSSIVVEEHAAQLPPEGQALLQRVAQSATQMQQLLDDLLEYSRMGQANLTLGEVSLQAAVQDALALLQEDIRARKAVIMVDESLPVVIGHAATIVTLINNFVSNALKFMKPGEQPKIRISAQDREPRVRLFVQDNGIGIEPKDLGKIFEVFQRLQPKSAYPGTGLGLAIVRKGAERMGGSVGADSVPGQGSSFWIELPKPSVARIAGRVQQPAG